MKAFHLSSHEAPRFSWSMALGKSQGSSQEIAFCVGSHLRWCETCPHPWEVSSAGWRCRRGEQGLLYFIRTDGVSQEDHLTVWRIVLLLFSAGL